MKTIFNIIVAVLMIQCNSHQLVIKKKSKKFQNFLQLTSNKLQIITSHKQKYDVKQPFSYFQEILCNKAKQKVKQVLEDKMPKYKTLRYTIRFKEVLYATTSECKVSSYVAKISDIP